MSLESNPFGNFLYGTDYNFVPHRVELYPHGEELVNEVGSGGSMARGDPEIRVRIPEDLKSQIEESAREHSRSLSGEVTLRLKKSFSSPFEQAIELLSPTEYMLVNLFREADDERRSQINAAVNKIFWRGK